ncbi:MAG: glycosyltransferase [Patescibacteria group bacterium]|jgi:glycosyltransferase involved in cell wall biosynthesis|nr:glycosyltransferase [Patescibacteria group bacterium]
MSEKSSLKYAIIIPCYNEEKFLDDTLRSLSNQDFKGNFEIIIVDNNSNDRTVQIAKKYSAKIVQEKTPGICFARQKGLNSSSADIIISTDADTVFKANWLTRIDQEFKKDPKLIALAGPCKFMKGPWWSKIYPYFLFGYVYLYSKIFKNPCYITATNTAFKKAYFDGYNTSLTQGGDELDLLDRIKNKGKFKFIFSNPVYTSPRRLNRGMFYNIFVSFIYYYLIGYKINKKFNRQIIGMAPAYREKYRRKLQLTPTFGLIALFLITSIIAFGIQRGHFDYSRDAIKLAYSVVKHIKNII